MKANVRVVVVGPGSYSPGGWQADIGRPETCSWPVAVPASTPPSAPPWGNAPKHMKATSVGRFRSLTGRRFAGGPQEMLAATSATSPARVIVRFVIAFVDFILASPSGIP